MHPRVTLVKETNLCCDYTVVTSSPTAPDYHLFASIQQQPNTQGVIQILSGANPNDARRC